MSQAAIKFGCVPEVNHTARRAVGFLEGDGQLNASDCFRSLKPNEKKFLLASIGQWVIGANGPKNRMHGFPNDVDYSECFVFKVKNRRFYGYLCHPRARTNPPFLVCVLCIHAKKNKWETDRSELARVKKWSLYQLATEATQSYTYSYEVRKTE